MTNSATDTGPFTLRADLGAGLAAAWSELGAPGAWLDGRQRLAAAHAARDAWACTLCQHRRQALSPYGIDGQHGGHGDLPPSWTEVVHRVVTDSGRITGRWFRSVVGVDLQDDEFIELISVATLATCGDTFIAALGLPPMPLPAPVDGAPQRTRPGNASPGPGRTPSIAPQDAGPELGRFYDNGPQFIRRALTLVPDELRRFWGLMDILYLPDPGIVELDRIERHISRAQMEFLAARVSALLNCFY